MSSEFDQTEFLRKKKEEILAKKKAQAASTATNSTVAKPTGPVPFANDGSFLERFKAMQKKQKAQQIKEEPKSPTNTHFKSDTKPSSTMKTVKKDQPLQKSHSVFIKEEPDDKKLVTSNITRDSDYELAQELAERVQKEGVQAEMMARIQGRTDPRYQFLFNPSSPVAQFYQTQLENLKHEKQSTRTTDSFPSLSSSTPSQSSTIPSTDKPPAGFMSEFEKAKALVRAKAAAMLQGGAGGGATAAVVTNTVSEQEIRRQKEIEEQKMMNEIYMKVIQQQMAAANEQSRKRKRNPDKPKYEYDSDEDTEGGTWEHKKRTSEMQKTAEKALELTDNAKGMHHIADFLPPDELEKFLEKVKAVKEGREADFSDYAKYKIGEDNVGYKMLMKAGWQEGSGLGSKGEGITAPINKGKTTFDHGGIGTEKVAEVKKDDDDFDVYRKRMMLAYKFRPNPLNNPRRPYYE